MHQRYQLQSKLSNEYKLAAKANSAVAGLTSTVNSITSTFTGKVVFSDEDTHMMGGVDFGFDSLFKKVASLKTIQLMMHLSETGSKKHSTKNIDNASGVTQIMFEECWF